MMASLISILSSETMFAVAMVVSILVIVAATVYLHGSTCLGCKTIADSSSSDSHMDSDDETPAPRSNKVVFKPVTKKPTIVASLTAATTALASMSTNSRGSSNPPWSDALTVVEGICKRLGEAQKNGTDPTEMKKELKEAQAELYKIIYPLAEKEKDEDLFVKKPK